MSQLISCVVVYSTWVSLPPRLPDALVDLIAHRFRVLGEPTRIQILDALRQGPATVAELEVSVGTSQQNVSKHLALLLDECLVSRRKEGNRAYYSIADQSLFELCEVVCGSLRDQLTQREALLPAGVVPIR